MLHALFHDGIWLKSCVIQAKIHPDLKSNAEYLQKNDRRSDHHFSRIKGTESLYNKVLHNMRKNELNAENMQWHGNDAVDKRQTKREKRDVLGDETGYGINMPFSSPERIISHTNSNKNADFSHANLSKIVRLNDLISKFKFAKFEFDAVLSEATILNLANNDIEFLDESVVKGFKNIELLDLTYNKFENFNFSAENDTSTVFSSLKILNLTGNRLKSFQSAREMGNVNQIDLSCNLLSEPTQLNLSQLSYLDYMDLSCNRLNRLHTETLQNMTNMKMLILAGNHLTKIQADYFSCLVSIEVLILSNNNITDIESDAFVHLANLQFLDLSHNNLNARSVHALQNIPDLSGLSVAYNKELGNALEGFVTSWSIKELDVSGTGLVEIPAALAQSVHLLNLSQNHFTVNIRCYQKNIIFRKCNSSTSIF